MTEEQYRDIRNPDGSLANGFKGKIEVDPDSYCVSNKYYIDGIECPKVVLNSPQAKNFAAYALIKKDLKYVLKAFKYAISIATDDIHVEGEENAVKYRAEVDSEADILKAFYISGIVTYGKCFTKADGRRVKLEYKNIFTDDEKGLQALHLELMEQRHQYIAHGGKTKYEAVNPVLVLHPDESLMHDPILLTETVHVDGFGKEDFQKFFDLVLTVDSRLNDILRTKSESLCEKEVATKGVAEWYEQSKT